jgi:lysophospholipase L1-like esterase
MRLRSAVPFRFSDTVRTLRLAAATVSAVLGVALAGCGGDVKPTGYVALGDSFTSGMGQMPIATTDVPRPCFQSPKSYPYYVQEKIKYPEYKNVSCAGAQTIDMIKAQGLDMGLSNPPQLDALSKKTKLITLGIGGNDAGFWYDVTKCFPATRRSNTPCRDTFIKNGVDTLRGRSNEVGVRVARVLDEIKKRAPAARVIVPGYPRILPPDGRGCRNSMRASAPDAAYFDGIERHINSVIEQAAKAKGATYVDVYTPSVGHDACKSPQQRWVEPLVNPRAFVPVHPNEAGGRAIAEEILKALEN